MSHELSFRIALAALLGLIAAGGNLLGGYFVVYREWPRRYLQYFSRWARATCSRLLLWK